MNVVLFSYHYFESKSRAGFHHLAEAYWDLGWNVVFVTAPVSWLSWISRDRRLAYPLLKEANQLKPVRERLHSYVLFTPVHPANLRSALLNRLSGRLLVTAYEHARLGPLAEMVKAADYVIFESTPAIVLVPRVRALVPQARLVYRVSDDLEILRVHPAVIQAERRVLPEFDLVSVASVHTQRRLLDTRDVVFHRHAISKQLFEMDDESPYGGGVHACWVGRCLPDPQFLRVAAERFPDWTFHMIGPVPRTVSMPNVIWHGELEYAETVPFIKHADVGIALYGEHEGSVPDYLADSSQKIVQYAYSGLPIVAPRTLDLRSRRVFCYDPGDAASIVAALRAAGAAGKEARPGLELLSWHELADVLACEPSGKMPRRL